MVTKKQGIESGSNGTVIRFGGAQPTYLQSSWTFDQAVCPVFYDYLFGSYVICTFAFVWCTFSRQQHIGENTFSISRPQFSVEFANLFAFPSAKKRLLWRNKVRANGLKLSFNWAVAWGLLREINLTTWLSIRTNLSPGSCLDFMAARLWFQNTHQ